MKSPSIILKGKWRGWIHIKQLFVRASCFMETFYLGPAVDLVSFSAARVGSSVDRQYPDDPLFTSLRILNGYAVWPLSFSFCFSAREIRKTANNRKRILDPATWNNRGSNLFVKIFLWVSRARSDSFRLTETLFVALRYNLFVGCVTQI